MKSILTIALFALLSANCYAQTFSELVATAFTHLENDGEKDLENIYLRLYPAYVKEQVPAYQEAIAAASDGDNTKAFKQLHLLMADSMMLDDVFAMSFLQEIKMDQNFSSLHKDKRWNSLTQRMQEIESKYKDETRKKLLEIHNSDQGIRVLLLQAWQKFGKESEEARKIHAIAKRVDDKNALVIQDIIRDSGWLSGDEVGETGNRTFFLAIQHVEDTIVQKKYLPVLRKAVKEGNAEPWQYAFLQDRILMNQGKFQIYGTQKIVSDDPGRSYIIPLQDPNHVDSLRAEVGLGPLKEDLQEEGMHWDLEEYKKRLPEIQKMYRERFLKLKNERETKN